MTGTMPSEHIQFLVAGYVLGDLDADEATELERLMQHDPAIAQEVAQMQIALERSYGSPEAQPPAQLRAAILEAATPRKLRSLPLSRALNVAAAVLIIALGFNNYRLWQLLQTSQAQVATLTYSLRATSTNQATATLAVDPKTLNASLQVNGLPPLPEGKVYALWTVVEPNAPFTVDAKGAILTQAFTVNAQGNVEQKISVPPVFRSQTLVTKVAITVEDATAPQKHEGSPILITSL